VQSVQRILSQYKIFQLLISALILVEEKKKVGIVIEFFANLEAKRCENEF